MGLKNRTPGVGQRSLYVFTPTTWQSVFGGRDKNELVLRYVRHFLDVYVNGTLLAPDDFVATDGSTVTILADVPPGSVVVFVAMEVWSPANTYSITDADTLFGSDTLALVPGGRLTPDPNNPIQRTTLSSASICYVPYVHAMVPLWNGTRWTLHKLDPQIQNSLSLAGVYGPDVAVNGSLYDLFAWYDADSDILRLVRGPAWTDTDTRSAGTALTLRDGRLLNAVAITGGPDAERGLYLGTMMISPGPGVNFEAGGRAAGGSQGKIHIWNAYNRVVQNLEVGETAASWTYSSATWRPANNSNGFRHSFICGYPAWAEDFESEYLCVAACTSGTSATVGIWHNANSGNPHSRHGRNNDTTQQTLVAGLSKTPTLGLNYVQAAEQSGTEGTAATFFGDDATTKKYASAMSLRYAA